MPEMPHDMEDDISTKSEKMNANHAKMEARIDANN
jgi:hypothetical protein